MGIDKKVSLLPAPTESESTTGATEFESRLTDMTSYSLPEDGSPITITTRRRRLARDGLGHNSKKSHTSLLIEYFEGSSSNPAQPRRPSVRVKVRPSSRVRSKSSNDHIKISERNSTRLGSHVKRSRISSNTKPEKHSDVDGDIQSNGSCHSTGEDSNFTSRGSGQIDVEITPRRHGSPLIPINDQGTKDFVINPSELSSVPHDSFLDANIQFSDYYKRNQSVTTEKTRVTGTTSELKSCTGIDQLAVPPRSRSRSLSRERIVVQKAVEKVRSENSIQRRRKHSSRSRSVSSEIIGEAVKPLKKSNRSHNLDVMASGADTSLLNSHLSAKSGEARSYRSGISKSSINNPKLLETVEDAIRRLILPELTALKREQSKHTHRDRRSSITSASVHSRESRESGLSRKRSDNTHGIDTIGRPEVGLNNSEVLPGDNLKGTAIGKHTQQTRDDSADVFECEISTETIIQDSHQSPNKNSYERNQGLEIENAGNFVGDSKILITDPPKETVDHDKNEPSQIPNDRGKDDGQLYRINDNPYNLSHRIGDLNLPMPLMIDNNPSEMTRSSILSSKSETLDTSLPPDEISHVTPPSVHHISNKTPVGLQKSLGTHHSNISRGNVNLNTIDDETWQRPTEYELDEHGRKIIPNTLYDEKEIHTSHSSQMPNRYSETKNNESKSIYNRDQDRENVQGRAQYFYQDIQEVPPPLRYIPYAQQRRGLSPIQSVSGWTEGEPDNRKDSRLSRSTGSYSSIGRNAIRRQSAISNRSYDSIGSHENPYDFPDVRQGGLADSEITQETDYVEEHDMEINRYHDIERDHFTTSGPRIDHQNITNINSSFIGSQNLDAPNTSIFKTKMDSICHAADAKSAVASIVNASDLTGLSGIHSHFDTCGVQFSAEDELEKILTVHTRTKNDFKERTKDEDATNSNRASRQNSPVIGNGEYDVDDNKRKSNSPDNQTSLSTERALTPETTKSISESIKKGVKMEHGRYACSQKNTRLLPRKSFKERAMETSIQLQLRQQDIEEKVSHKEYQLGASGIPDIKNPMPEIGFGHRNSDTPTYEQIDNGSKFETQNQTREHWSPSSLQKFHQTSNPTQNSNSESGKGNTEDSRNVDVSSSGGVRLNKGLDNENLEEWRRDSSERKRDTLVTNPYENSSPAAANNSLDCEITGFQGFERKLSYQARGFNLSRDEGCNVSLSSTSRSPQPTTPKSVKENANITPDAACDPFYTPKHYRSLSGLSHGMHSPLYDGATGNGIERIESRDIIALMDHLTVRDAQRTARDTEILVTLVRAAAEMRNSFEDMKRLLADTEDVIITEVQANTDRSVQKVLHGPRPAPQTGRRSLRRGSCYEIYDDMPAKKTNVFRRALKGLSLKSANDLVKIEEMLVQLLGEVEGLKVAQGLKPVSYHVESNDRFNRVANVHDHDDCGEEGNLGISSPGRSSTLGHVPPVESRSTSNMRLFDGRKHSDHRVSTVPEADEQKSHSDSQTVLHKLVENTDNLPTPVRDFSRKTSAHPTCSSPLSEGNHSNHNMQTATIKEKPKKQKLINSSEWIPKVSRWSETTATSVFRGFRGGGRSSGFKAGEDMSPGRWGSDNELGNFAGSEPDGTNKPYS